MPATKRYLNWTGVTFTPASGTAVTFTGVTSVSFDSGGSVLKFAGDADRFNTLVVNDFNEPTASVQTADVAAASALAPGTVGTLVAILNDAKNGEGSGAVTYTLANAVVSKNPMSAQHRQWGQATVTFESFSADGVTNPLSLTVAT